jgi:hypothetical protein
MEAESWLALAVRPDVVRRAARTAAVVGALLIGINHGDALMQGSVTLEQTLKMILTVFVPYGVSTYSSVGALRAAHG